jgi:hypothetical protein
MMKAQKLKGGRKMQKLAILAALLLSMSSALAQDIARHPGEGDVQRYGGQWRYMHHYWGRGHVDPKSCWEWDSIDGRWEWECE